MNIRLTPFSHGLRDSRRFARRRWPIATAKREFASSSSSENAEPAQTDVTDVLIVGGGVVGCTLAHQLSKRAPSLSVGLVEARSGPNLSKKLPFAANPRSYALSPFSIKLLELDQDTEASTRLGTYDSMQVWESGHPASLLFGEKDIVEGDILGAVVEDDVIVRHLWKRIQGRCQLFTDQSVSKISLPNDATSSLARVQLSSSQKQDASSATKALKEIQTKLVIGADGANSIVRRHVGIPRTLLEYNQHALTFTVKLKGTHGKRAFQRFVPAGPIALLPTFLDDHSIVVWSTHPSQAQEWKNNPQLTDHINSLLQDGPERVESFFDGSSSSGQLPPPLLNLMYGAEKMMELAHYGPAMLAQEQTGPFLAPPVVDEIVSPQFTFPLSCAQVSSYIAPRLALAGDAAHSVHPMAGQGLNLGLQDVANLVDVIVKAHEAGMDLSMFLNEYETSRKIQVSLTLGGIHALQRVFGAQSAPFKHLKGIGMNLVQNVGPLRKQLATAACHGVPTI